MHLLRANSSDDDTYCRDNPMFGYPEILHIRMLVGVAGIVLLFAPECLRGQGASEELAVTIATISYYKERFAPEGLGIEPRVLVRRSPTARGWGEERPEQEMQRLLTTTRTTRFRREPPSCTPAEPAACRLAGVDAYLALTRPAIEANKATVYIHAFHNVKVYRTKYSILDQLTAVVELAKAPNGWTVVKFDILSQS